MRLFRKKSILDDEINKLVLALNEKDEDSVKYQDTLACLERLIQLKKEESKGISPDTLVMVAGNLAGILIIVMYEQRHVITSKGMNFIQKPKGA